MTEGSFQTLNKTGQEIFSCLVLYCHTAQKKNVFDFCCIMKGENSADHC